MPTDEAQPEIELLPTMAWVYHEVGSTEAPIARADDHNIVLDPQKDWCMTHRPALTCQCGQYALVWHEEPTHD